jgi:predicted HAD superfamily Cof-like phosphohydrolase
MEDFDFTYIVDSLHDLMLAAGTKVPFKSSVVTLRDMSQRIIEVLYYLEYQREVGRVTPFVTIEINNYRKIYDITTDSDPKLKFVTFGVFEIYAVSPYKKAKMVHMVKVLKILERTSSEVHFVEIDLYHNSEKRGWDCIIN